MRAGKGKLVIVRRHVDPMFENVFKLARESKQLIEANIDIENDEDKTEWVFMITGGELPLDEISAIKQKRPDDRVTIGVTQAAKVKGFKNVEYCGLTK